MPGLLCYAVCIATSECPMEIRPAQAGDLQAAAELWYQRMAMLRENSSWIEFAPEAIDRWRSRAMVWIDAVEFGFYIAESGGRIVGLALVTAKAAQPGLHPERIGVLAELAVDLHQARSGLSGRLIEAAKAWLRARDIAVLDVDAPANYAVEDAFWRAQGAALTARSYRLRL